MKKINYITTNKFKVTVAKGYLEPHGFEIEAKSIDCPEIQADTIEEVAKFSSKYASDFLKEDTLKNDSGLVIPALNGFPSAYTKYVDQTIGEIAKVKSGENGWSWDFIFIPKGYDKTMACFEDEERWKLWDETGYKQLAEYLKKS